MAMIDISVVPVGTGSPSASEFVAGTVKIVKNEPVVKYRLTPMNTIIEGELEQLLAVAKKMHDSVFNAGAARVVTTIRIDERRDKPLTMEGKLKAVEDKLNK